jgi:SSS family solute:Na+ symporter
MLIGIVAVIAAVLKSNGGFMAALYGNPAKGIEGLANVVEVSKEGIKSAPGIFTSFFGPDPLSLLGVIILTSLGTWGLPQMVSKFYSIKSEKAISKGTVISTFFAFIVAGGCYFLGSFGRLYANSDKIARGANGVIVFDSIIPAMLNNLPNVMIGIVIILVFAASISTLSSLVMASSSTLTLDFLKGHIIKRINEKKQLLIIRVLIVVFIAISSLIAIVQSKSRIIFIAQLMGVSWGALAGSFLAPFLYGLYWKRATKISIWCCFIFSTVLMSANVILNVFFSDFFKKSVPDILQSPINAGAFTMLAGLIIVPLVSKFTRAPDKTAVENCFSCYDETVNVKVRDDLGA